MTTPSAPTRAIPSVAMITLGCARNEVDSEELAGRLEAGGFRLTSQPDEADVVMVNTCGFVEAAKKDSVDTLLAAADLKRDTAQAVVAVGCLAERYGQDLAETLPEADAVLGFDQYPHMAERLTEILAGARPQSHVPADRRSLLPISPVDRPAASRATGLAVPGHGAVDVGAEPHMEDLPVGIAPASGPPVLRRRLDSGPMAPLKLASGCDRRCTFCAIPSFRGSFVSRRPADVINEARWLVDQGVREVFLVSENTTSYGKDLGDLRLLESLLPALAEVEGLERIRVSYLQPAETRPALIEIMTSVPTVADYFDLSFQHASPTVLRRMRRFGDPESFLNLLGSVRRLSPRAGARANVIVGFPGETERDVRTLCDFLIEARLDVTGVFGYSDEDGTEAASFDDKIDPQEVNDRVATVTALVEELTAQRAEERIGEHHRVLIERIEDGEIEGRGEHQGPEVDGVTLVVGDVPNIAVGDLVDVEIVDTLGVDLHAVVVGSS